MPRVTGETLVSGGKGFPREGDPSFLAEASCLAQKDLAADTEMESVATEGEGVLGLL